MSLTVTIQPRLISWAIKRSGLPVASVEKRFPVSAWQTGTKKPTLKQLESFAKLTMTPVGYLFLPKPPVENLPVPDFRTFGDSSVKSPTPNLIDTLNETARRQQWMREYVVETGQGKLTFVGSLNLRTSPEKAAVAIRKELGLRGDWAKECKTWEESLKKLRESIEDIGVMVSVSGVVGMNNKRPLDPEEFRGFVFADSFAPLVFVNGADTKSAQMFTLAHELAHIWIGKDAVFNLENLQPSKDETEIWCNAVAAEFLLPRGEFLEQSKGSDLNDLRSFYTIAKHFKVSPLVAARRSLDLKLIDKAKFFSFYAHTQRKWAEVKEARKANKGGNFYSTQTVRLGRRFSEAIVQASLEGRILYHDAYQLTGFRGETFERYANRLAKGRGK